MMTFVPGPVHGTTQVYVCLEQPQYSIRPEWARCRDGVHRPRYRAYYGNHVVGEIMPASSRDAVIADLQDLIEAPDVATDAAQPVAQEDDGDVE